jgi:hypothetical protein
MQRQQDPIPKRLARAVLDVNDEKVIQPKREWRGDEKSIGETVKGTNPTATLVSVVRNQYA